MYNSMNKNLSILKGEKHQKVCLILTQNDGKKGKKGENNIENAAQMLNWPD